MLFITNFTKIKNCLKWIVISNQNNIELTSTPKKKEKTFLWNKIMKFSKTKKKECQSNIWLISTTMELGQYVTQQRLKISRMY